MDNRVERYGERLPSRVQAERAIERARNDLGLAPLADGQTHMHVHHHYAPEAPPAAAVAPRERGPLEQYGPWLVLAVCGLVPLAGIVVLLMFVFGTIIAGLQAMAGSLLALGVVAVFIVAAAKAPAGKGKK